MIFRRLKKTKTALQKANDELEKRIEKQATDIHNVNEALRQEIAERKRAQLETKMATMAAEAALRTKSEFLTNMSHELRRPLNHILGFTELILDKKVGELNDKTSSMEYIQISVMDSGIGLKKENLTNMFQPFEQVENSSSRQFQGTGLGLSLAKSLVELHGGKIWAESDSEGLGSMFSFSLPV